LRRDSQLSIFWDILHVLEWCLFLYTLMPHLNNRSIQLEWIQLIVLSGTHFLVDMFANMLPSILPAVREQFTLSLSMGAFVLVLLTLTSNFVQILTGHTRADKTVPMFLHLGLVLSAVICLLSALPRSGGGIPLVILLGIVTGVGIAVAHPEGLRAIFSLRRIPPAISTAIFMTGGFFGFAAGGVISTHLVSRFGLAGLYPLTACPLVGVLMVILSKVRLSADHTEDSRPTDCANTPETKLPFWQLMVMAVPAAVSTTVVLSLLPTSLSELGFKLTFGGFSATMFGLGATVGPFVWAAIAQRKGELPCSTLAFLLCVPLLAVYLLMINSATAVWILSGLGFCSMSAYILIITIARHASGLSLGRRMGFIVGGTWGVANLVFLALIPVAEHYGTESVLKFMPLGYLFSGAFGLYIMSTNRQQGNA
jgi:FSR family fosmidomycin resistance protein-like MFS transporter